MPDRHGQDLPPGTWVLYCFLQHRSGAVRGVPATVVRELPDNRYLIQLDPRGPLPKGERIPSQETERRELTELLVTRLGIEDDQNPIAVSGAVLEDYWYADPDKINEAMMEEDGWTEVDYEGDPPADFGEEPF